MGTRPNPNDISIGEDCWITFGDTEDFSRAVEIDPYLAPILPFLESLEVVCVAGCCGIDAFCLWPEEIEKATAAMGENQRQLLATNLMGVHDEIDRLSSDTLCSTRINQCFPKSVFMELLAHIRGVVGLI